MAHYRSACTGKALTLWRNGKPFHGSIQQLSRQAQDTVELWKTYDHNQIKIREIEDEDLAAVYQRIISGVNITTNDVRKYLYSCTGLFTQVVEIDLIVSPNYTIPKNTRISPLSLYAMATVNVLGNAATVEKYKDTLMNLLFSIRFQRGENPAHQDQLKKTARKTRSNWNHYAWMSNIACHKLDDLLAAYDWYLFLKEIDDQPLPFGTVATQWKDMGAFRDFCFIAELFPGDTTRPIRWIQNPVVADSVLEMHLITIEIGSVRSSFPYCKAMNIVTKSDLSVSEHAIMHDYIHAMGALIGNTGLCNSRFVSNSIARRDVCMATMCIMATGAMKSEVQLDDDDSKVINETTAKGLRLSVQEVNQIPDNVGVWIQTYNKDPSRV